MKHSFLISAFIFVIFTVISGIRMILVQHKLMNYLRQNHYEKWKYLTTIPGLGPGYVNGLLVVAFLFSSEDLGDSEVMRMKIIIRNSFIYMLTGMMATFITFFILFMLYPEQ